MRAALYVRTSAADAPGLAEEQLAILRAYAERRGWAVDLVASDVGAGVGRRPGLQRVIRWASGPTPPARRDDSPEVYATRGRVILTSGLWRLFRSLRHLALWGHQLVANGVAVVALGDGSIDSTDIAGHSRWVDLVVALEGISRLQHAEAVQCARIHSLTGRGGDNWGRPVREVNPWELRKFWEGSATLRPLSTAEIARKLKVSRSTVRRRVAEQLDRKHLNRATRESNLALHGGPRKGGRPIKKRRLRDDDLLAALYGAEPLDVDALARKARVPKADLLTRIEALKLRRRR